MKIQLFLPPLSQETFPKNSFLSTPRALERNGTGLGDLNPPGISAAERATKVKRKKMMKQRKRSRRKGQRKSQSRRRKSKKSISPRKERARSWHSRRRQRREGRMARIKKRTRRKRRTTRRMHLQTISSLLQPWFLGSGPQFGCPSKVSSIASA